MAGDPGGLSFTARLQLWWIYARIAVNVICLRLVWMVPYLGEKVARRRYVTGKLAGSGIDHRDHMANSGTYKAWVCRCHSAAVDFHKKVTLNGKMWDVDLHRLNGDLCKLSDFLKPGRPLVVNFGSCT